MHKVLAYLTIVCSPHSCRNICAHLTASQTGMQALARLPALRHLELAECDSVTDDGLHALAELPGLDSLALKSLHQVTDEGMQTLARQTTLRSVTLSGKGLRPATKR